VTTTGVTSPAAPPFRARLLTMPETKTDGTIIVNVRLFATIKPDLKYLTRFQYKMPDQVRGPTLRLRLNPEVETVGSLKKKVEEARGTHPVEKLRKGGGPLGIELEPDTATLASVGLTRDHSVWEYVWEDSEAESAKFEEELDTVRGYVHEFMLKHPDMNGSGRQTGEKKTEESTWTKKQRRKRQEMETAVAEYRKEKEKKEAAKRAAKAAKEAKAAEAAKAADATAA
jgi:hypothetical protein